MTEPLPYAGIWLPRMLAAPGSRNSFVSTHPAAVPSHLTTSSYKYAQPARASAISATDLTLNLLLTLQPHNMASEDTNTAVDATPISPVRSNERRNSLEKHLQHRPEAQDLKNRHILLDTTTAPYVS